MKKWIIFFLLITMLLSACTPASTVPGTTAAATESLVTEPAWAGYSGTSKGYTFLHSETRDYAWEEDILYFAGSYLDNYGALTHFPSRVEYVDDVEYEDYLYIPELRDAFIAEINALIPQIPDLTDTQILYELQRIVSLLRDGHANLIVEHEMYFPIFFEPFFEEDTWVYRVSFVPTKYDHAIMARLVGVNGIPLDEVIERMAAYLSYENQQMLTHTISGDSHPGSIAELDLLRVCGILGPSDEKATYNLITETGESLDITLSCYTIKQMISFGMTAMTHQIVYPSIYGDPDVYYFYEMYPEDSMIYVRVNQFETMPEYTFMDFGNQIIREVREAGGMKKIVIDLRRNPGGYQFLGYPEFIRALERMDIEDIYVLVDQGTFSCAIIMASNIKHYFPDAMIIGTPAGQPPNFYAGMWDGDYVMPNCQVECRIPTAFHNIFPDYEYDALMPDLIVYPTLNDYMYSIDTILEAARAQ